MAKGECLFLGCDGSRRLREIPKSAEEEESNETGPTHELVWDLSFEFAAAPNRRQWVANIGYVNKRGWEYMHVVRKPLPLPEKFVTPSQDETTETDGEYAVVEVEPVEDESDSETKTTPVGAYIEQVYPYSDFDLFGFNTAF